MVRSALIAASLCLVAAASAGAESGYPIRDGYLATVIGTARADQASVPDAVPDRIRGVDRFPEREVPRVFFSWDEFRYTVSAQRDEAPLIFVIAGTGASHRSQKMRFLQRAFFGAGFHVVLLSSPTSPDFMLTGSDASMPGWMKADVDDLYELMKMIRADLGRRIEVSRIFLTGYSLGGSQAAFLGDLDRREGRIGFDRILMINPSVSLFTSIEILDKLFEIGLPEGAASAEALIGNLLSEISAYTREQQGVALDSELLYRIAEQRIAEGRPPRREALQGMIAAVFRLAAGSLLFTADVLHGGGHVVEADGPLGVTSSLTVPFKRAMRWPFGRYLDDMLVPFWNDRDPTLDRDALIRDADLRSIESFLAEAPHVAVMTNADDFIMTPGDLEFLRTTFGSRATIFPTGGHCGNLQHRDTVAAMLEFFGAGR